MSRDELVTVSDKGIVSPKLIIGTLYHSGVPFAAAKLMSSVADTVSVSVSVSVRRVVSLATWQFLLLQTDNAHSVGNAPNFLRIP
jgi:hypothetical protein